MVAGRCTQIMNMSIHMMKRECIPSPYLSFRLSWWLIFLIYEVELLVIILSSGKVFSEFHYYWIMLLRTSCFRIACAAFHVDYTASIDYVAVSLLCIMSENFPTACIFVSDSNVPWQYHPEGNDTLWLFDSRLY